MPTQPEGHKKTKSYISKNYTQLKIEFPQHTSDPSWACLASNILPHQDQSCLHTATVWWNLDAKALLYDVTPVIHLSPQSESEMCEYLSDSTGIQPLCLHEILRIFLSSVEFIRIMEGLREAQLQSPLISHFRLNDI